METPSPTRCPRSAMRSLLLSVAAVAVLAVPVPLVPDQHEREADTIAAQLKKQAALPEAARQQLKIMRSKVLARKRKQAVLPADLPPPEYRATRGACMDKCTCVCHCSIPVSTSEGSASRQNNPAGGLQVLVSAFSLATGAPDAGRRRPSVTMLSGGTTNSTPMTISMLSGSGEKSL